MQEQIVDILVYMKEHLSQEQSIEEIAQQFGYSKYHFSRKFKKITGFAAADYLSSLKIEQAKQSLLKENTDVTNASLDAGFSSLGTFSKNFAMKTGLSPREYIKQVDTLYGITQVYEGDNVYTHVQDRATLKQIFEIDVHLSYPSDFKASITFVGLFLTPIPNHPPIVGVALKRKQHFTFKDIPFGRYYLLACSIEETYNPIRFFDLSESYRGRGEEAIEFPKDHKLKFEVKLREARPEDPPILINLPKLLADTIRF